MFPAPLCTECSGPLDATSDRHGFFSWAILWRCGACTLDFHCCDRSCGPKNAQITPFASRDQLLRHNRRYHKKPRLTSAADPIGALVENDDPFDANDGEQGPNYQVPTEAFLTLQDHEPTKRFFEDLQHHSLHVALQGLVARSCYLDAKIMTKDALTQISVGDLTLFFRIARLVFQLGPKH